MFLYVNENVLRSRAHSTWTWNIHKTFYTNANTRERTANPSIQWTRAHRTDDRAIPFAFATTEITHSLVIQSADCARGKQLRQCTTQNAHTYSTHTAHSTQTHTLAQRLDLSIANGATTQHSSSHSRTCFELDNTWNVIVSRSKSEVNETENRKSFFVEHRQQQATIV